MTRFTQLQSMASKSGYTVGIFTTNGTNYYQDAVLYLAVGQPKNRNSPLVLYTWDVSYSIGTKQDGNSKFARAMTECKECLGEKAPIPDTLLADHADAVRTRRNATRRERRASKRAALAQLTPTTLAEAQITGNVSHRILATFGIDDDEHEELMQETGLVAYYHGQLLVRQKTLSHGLGWYPITAGTTDRPTIRI